MKKFTKIVGGVVAVAAVASAFALAGCGEKETEYKGSYSYDSPWGGKYGVNVTVTVSGDKITKVVCDADTDTLFNVTTSWEDKANWVDHQAEILKAYEGKTVAEVKGYTVAVVSESEANDYTPKGQPKSVSESSLVATGATQSSGRLLLAVQDALKDVK